MPVRLRLLFLLSVLAAPSVNAAARPSPCAEGERANVAAEYVQAEKAMSACLATPGLDKAARRRALQVRAWASYSLERDASAVRDQEASFQISPPNTISEMINYASYLRRVARYEDSLQVLLAVEKADAAAGGPGMMTQYNLGWTLAELGRHEQAIKAFSVGIPLQPEYPFAYWRRALSYEALGRRAQAHADIERAAALMKHGEMTFPDSALTRALRKKVKEYGLGKKYGL